MAVLPRKTQKIFGLNGNNGVPGSAQASGTTSGSLSNDLAILQSLAAFADGLNSVVLSGKSLPPLQEDQALDYIETSQLAYIFQEGIPEYDAGTEYRINSLVKQAGTTTLWKSLVNVNTGNPLVAGANWQQCGDLSNLINIAQATELLLGIAEIATQVKTNTGTDDLTFVTPLKLATWFNNKRFKSVNQTITLAGALTLAHGLGKIPDLFIWQMQCITAEHGYSINDIVFANPMMGQTASIVTLGVSVVPDTTNLNIRMSDSTPRIMNKTTGATADITLANWQYIFIAFSLT